MRLEELESARGVVRARPAPGFAAAPARPALYLQRRALWALAAGAALLWSLWQAGVFRADLVNEAGWPLLARLGSAALRPELGRPFLDVVFGATLTTLAFAACGTALSLVLGSLGGLLSSEAWWESVRPSRRGRGLGGFRAPWLAVRTALGVPRAIHEIVWGVLLVGVLGLDPVVAILAIAIPFGAITAKVFSELIDEAPRGSLKALRAAGVPPAKAFLYSLLPEAFPDLVSYAFYRFECAIRSAAVLGIVGVGGLGYEIFLSLKSLRYEEVWTLVYALVVLCGLSDLWSGAVRGRLGAALDRSTRPGRRDSVVTGSIVGILILVALSFAFVGADFGRLTSPRAGALLGDLVARAFPPSLGGMTLLDLVGVAGATLAMSILAIAGAAVGGTILSFPAARNILLPRGGASGRRALAKVLALAGYVASRALLLFFRAVPAPIWALAFLFVFFPGVLPGALALGVYTLGVLGRLMAETTENLDARPFAALRVQGVADAHAFLYGLLPAALARHTALTLYRWEVAVRATAMVGLVGAGGLGRLLTERLSSFDYAAVTTVLLAYMALAWLVDLLSAVVRRDLR